MKIAYLIDKESVGGGCEYIRRKSAADAGRGDASRIFLSERSECRAGNLDGWGADLIVVNHLKALVQLLVRPWERPRGRIRFVVHGIHLRKYDWMIRESGGIAKSAVLRLKRSLRRRLEAWLYSRCDEIVALTRTDHDDILRLYGEKLHVVIEPNTLDGWTPAPVEGLPHGADGAFDYVCIGRFDYQKGQDRWIRRMGSGGQDSHGGGRTLFIGDGDALEPCKELARRLGVAERCVFAGAIRDADRYLKCAGTVVSPSRWEGMPYLMMKARSLGCRILATDCPGNRDVLSGYGKWELLEL